MTFLFLLSLVAGNTGLFERPVAKLDFIVTPGDIYAMALDDSGNFYATVLLEAQIQVFGPDGGKRTPIGRAGKGPGELQYPMPLAYDGGYLYTVDNGRGLLYRFSLTTGQVAQEWTIGQANAIRVEGNKLAVVFNAPQKRNMIGLCDLEKKLDFTYVYEEPCCLNVKGSKQGAVSFDQGGVWGAYSGEYRLFRYENGKLSKRITEEPNGYQVPTLLKNTSRFDRKAASAHYRTFDKIRNLFVLDNKVIVYRAKSIDNGNLDVYSLSDSSQHMSAQLNNIVPFQVSGDKLYAYKVGEDDNIWIVQVLMN